MNKNQLAFEKLIGTGVEFGALHNPVEINKDKATVLYADKLIKAEAIAAFPELEDVAQQIVETDLTVDLDKNTLGFIHEKELDFVIANHVIEHLVNPIRFLKNINDNLKVGGGLFLTVPNKDHTHDKNRALTRYRTLVAKFYLRTKNLSNERITDYLKYKLPVANIHPKTREYFLNNGLPLSYYDGNKIPRNPIKKAKLFEYHRSRSIHVHVWNRETFDFFLRRTIDLFNFDLEIESALPAESSAGEMIYFLRKH